MTRRQVEQTNLSQGVDEQLVYTITTTPWGDNPSSVTVKAYDESNSSEDVSTTVLSGSASVTGNVITLPTVKSLTVNHEYRIEVKFTTDDGNVWEAFINLPATR